MSSQDQPAAIPPAVEVDRDDIPSAAFAGLKSAGPEPEGGLYLEEESRPDSGNTSVLSECRRLTPEGETYLFRSLAFVRNRADAIQSTIDPARPSKRAAREVQALHEESGRLRGQIAQANLRLVASIARGLAQSADDFDEMFAEGNAILLYAIDKFDYTRGFRFSTYLTHAVQRHLYRFLKRKSRRAGREFSSNQERLAAVSDVPASDEPTAEEAIEIARVVLSKIDETLDEREKAIILGRFGLDESEQQQSFRSLGEQLGLSKERIRQIFHGALKKLGKVAEPFAERFE